VVGSPEVAAVTASLIAALCNYGLANPDIRVSTVPRIERHASTQKLKRFIALDTPP
jgi:hypothetical protein